MLEHEESIDHHPDIRPSEITAEPLTVEQVLQLPDFQHLQPATLAKWRLLGKGPPYYKCGGKIFYTMAAIMRWRTQEMTKNEHSGEIKSLALSLSDKGRSLRARHRLGGHKIQSQRGQGH